MNDEIIMEDLLAFAKRKFESKGILPFCAFIAKDGVLISKGYYDRGDSYGAVTNHGEMNAIRKACYSLLSYEALAGFDLFTTCEPCLACFETALLVGVKRIIFAATHNDPELSVFFNFHTYFPEDYVRDHPDEIELIESNKRNEAVKLIAAARKKYGF